MPDTFFICILWSSNSSIVCINQHCILAYNVVIRRHIYRFIICWWYKYIWFFSCNSDVSIVVFFWIFISSDTFWLESFLCLLISLLLKTLHTTIKTIRQIHAIIFVFFTGILLCNCIINYWRHVISIKYKWKLAVSFFVNIRGLSWVRSISIFSSTAFLSEPIDIPSGVDTVSSSNSIV